MGQAAHESEILSGQRDASDAKLVPVFLYVHFVQSWHLRAAAGGDAVAGRLLGMGGVGGEMPWYKPGGRGSEWAIF